jgi:hypothetical protein
MNKSKSEQIVIITGDVTMDWNLARNRRVRKPHMSLQVERTS